MPIFRTFAKRKEEAAKAGKPTIYSYDSLPDGFRAQVLHILRDSVIRLSDLDGRREWWVYIHDALAREMGVLDIVRGHSGSRNDQRMNDCLQFLSESQDVHQVLSLIELLFKFIDIVIRQALIEHPHAYALNPQTPDDAIEELNHRFQEHSIGYQYLGGQIIEVSSQYLHAETIEPAITLLHEEGFEGALAEFMTAHKHFREGSGKEAIAQALNAFESTMKIICENLHWDYSQNDTASKLLATLFGKGLVPSQMQSHFNGLKAVLEGGVPTVRNNFGGHGQGAETVVVPNYLVAYALHLAAANIVFLVEAYRSYKPDIH